MASRRKTLLALLLVPLLLLPGRPAHASGPLVTAFSTAGTLLIVAIPVAVVGYLIFKAAGGDQKAEQKPAAAPAPEQPAEKPSSQPATPSAAPAK